MNSKLLWLTPLFVLGLLLFGQQIGCGPSKDTSNVDVHGPHGGHTLTLSHATQYLMEFTLDESRRKIVIYTSEKSSHSPFAIPVSKLDAELESGGKSYDLTFVADPRSSDPQGCSSRFSIDFDDLPQQLMSVSRFTVNVSYTDGEETISASMQHSNNHRHDYHHD